MNVNVRPMEKSSRLRLLVVGSAVLAAAFLTWLQERVTASATDTFRVARGQLAQMHDDAQLIQQLRRTPMTAAARARSNQELLAQVEKALAAAGVDRALWQDSVPQPPTRIPNSDYMKVTTRLYFEDLTLQKVAAFSHHLRAVDPTLSVSGVNLANRTSETLVFDVEVVVSYLVFTPQHQQPYLFPR
jgi:hypothetical protein